MGNQGESKTLKRAMTRGWQISKKQYKFTVKNKCGPHNANSSKLSPVSQMVDTGCFILNVAK